MIFRYRNVDVFFKFVNNKKRLTNIYLHGWGTNHKSLEFCGESLKAENSLFVDFPPFGKSKTEPEDWSIFTYSNMVISLCKHLGIERFNLFGHSFGGRVAILISTICKEETNKLVLIDSAGVKPKRRLSYYIKVWKFKLRKRLGKDISKYGSEDYKRLSKNMKKVFTQIVNTDLEDFLPMIKAETLIVFGEKDMSTPLYMARKLKRGICNSKLVIMGGCGHFCFEEKRLEFLSVVKDFVEGEKT